MMNRMVPAVIDRASMVVSMNPLDPNPQAQAVEIGAPLRDLAPATQSPLMLRVNGQWLLRADWWRPVLPGDVIEWHVLPMGGQNSRAILTLVVMVVIAIYQPELLAAYGPTGAAVISAVASIAAVALINALIPIQQPQLGTTQSPNSVYNVALSANAARLYQPIPVIYGRMLTYPDFAAQPYSEHDANNNQYFYAVYCIGQGNYNVEQLSIGNSPIGSFDVQYKVLPPGALPSIARANVFTAPEVIGQDLLTGAIVGGFAACAPKFTVASIGIDVLFPKGLGLADSSGAIGPLSATFLVEAQPIDDFDVPTGPWYSLGSQTVTRSTNTPQRMSFRYNLPGTTINPVDGAFTISGSAGRVAVRMTRTDIRNEAINALHDIQWTALRSYMSNAAPLSPSATHLEVKIKATNLSGISQRKINGIWRRKLRTWSAGVWGPEIETRNPMWARLDKLTNAVYGDGLADARIDLQSHADLAAVYDARQDHFDILFDSKVTSIDADRTICMAGRAVPFQRAGVCTVVRDQLQTLPVTAFTSRDIAPGSMSIGYSLATEVTADAVIIEYFDNRAWDWREITCNAPGVVTPVNAVRQRVMGITGQYHANREGLYLAAQNVYRRKFPKFTTEMQGLIPAYGSAAMFHPALPGWGQTGDVAFWNASTLTMGLTEPAAFTSGANHFVSLLRDDGSVTPAIAVTPGPTANDIVLASAPLLADGVTLMTLVLDDANRERPKFVFGAQGQHRIMVRVLGIRKAGRGKDGAQSIEISTVAEDVRVHAVDAALLPSPGVVQDPVGSGVPGSTFSGGGTAVLVNLAALYPQAGPPISNGPSGMTIGYTLLNNGTSSLAITDTSGTVTSSPANAWMYYGAVEVATAALYEVRATDVNGTGAFSGSALGAWLNLGTTRSWLYDKSLWGTANYYGTPIGLLIEIRVVASQVVMASATMHLQINDTIVV